MLDTSHRNAGIRVVAAQTRSGPVTLTGSARHIGEPREVKLVCHSDIRGRAVTVLTQNDVGFATTRIFTVDRVGAVQQQDHVGILLQAVVGRNSLCDKVMRARHSSVVHVLVTDTCDLNDLIPEHIVAGQVVQFDIVEHSSSPMQS